MNYKEIMSHPLHPHPRMEDRLGVDDQHAIVDLLALVQIFNGGVYKGVSQVEVFKEVVECLRELVIMIDDAPEDIDSFTTQPAREILDKLA